jgi:hypothetical protein
VQRPGWLIGEWPARGHQDKWKSDRGDFSAEASSEEMVDSGPH